MAHFAKLDKNNIVIFVTVGRDEDKEDELTARTGDVYKQTSYNTFGGVHQLGGTPLRKNFASIGYTYDESKDAFIPPQTYPSWVLNETTCLWEAPLTEPNDGVYMWDETQYQNDKNNPKILGWIKQN
jgi:hypothetical protein|tara:strand:- start:871 stop:1251 length:381 start_codon:yes stop_codon:yes gene_type:complete